MGCVPGSRNNDTAIHHHRAAVPTSQVTTPNVSRFGDGIPVFYAGLNGSKCFRIPTIIRTSFGTLLAFAENRFTNCMDVSSRHDIVLRRSSDGGKTWSPMQVVVQGTVPCADCPAAVSNPNPVEVTLQSGSKAILLHYDTLNNPTVKRHGLDMQKWSYDDGVTWGMAAQIALPHNIGALVGPSVGIQSAAGTIYFSSAFGAFTDNGMHTGNPDHWLYWSKDFGRTWESSLPIRGHALDECSIAFLVSAADGRIAMNCRINGLRHRAQLIWAPDGTPISNVTHPLGLRDPICQGSLLNVRGLSLIHI